MKKKYFLFDFDDVLFNTKKFRDDIIHLFLKFGIPKKIFYETYKDFPAKNKEGVLVIYDPEKQFSKIKIKYGTDTKNLRKQFYQLLDNSKRYIFPDTTKFLKKLENDNLYIISYGKNKMQELKINNSEINKYIKNILIVNKSKTSAIPSIIKKNRINNHQIYFFEDRTMFINDVKKKYPTIKTILVKRKEGRYRDPKTKYCDYEIKNFKEAEKIIG